MLTRLTNALTKSIKPEHLIVWVLPALSIPALRYFVDPKEVRDKLFVRDLSTYTIGAGLFFAGSLLANKFLKPVIKAAGKRNLLSVLTGTTASILFAGLVAPSMSQRVIAKTVGGNKSGKLDVSSTTPDSLLTSHIPAHHPQYAKPNLSFTSSGAVMPVMQSGNTFTVFGNY